MNSQEKSRPDLMHAPVKLYGTRFCHLCEAAEAVVRQCQVEAEYVDIAEDDELLEKYGIRIPVLQRVDTGDELGWPFDAAAVSSFLK
jgi:glutaredoxin